jgi:dihydroflavonol-4-reductase
MPRAPYTHAVAKTLLTGGTGLIGSHLARALVQRGDDLRIAVRRSSKLDNLEGLEYEPVKCDILDRRALRRALRGVDRVFHAAGMTSLRAPAADVYRVNVEGTRTVLQECQRAGVERVVFTSSVAALGPAKPGSTADETQVFNAGRYGIPYVNAKHEAEKEALEIAAHGLPVVIVSPCHVFGPGDIYHSSTEIVRRFMMRRIPAYVEGAINIIDVADVAAGHLLADERGTPGERYILGNRNYTLDRLFADLGRISGVEPPVLKLPLPAALAFAASLERLSSRPPITTTEVRAAGLWWTYRNTKAKRELGFKPSPHEETLETTVNWYREHEGSKLAEPGARQPLPFRVAGFAVRQAGGIVTRLAS